MTAPVATGDGPTDDELLAALKRDPWIQQAGPAYFEIAKPFFLALPTILADLLDQPAAVDLITTAQLAFVGYCAEHGYIDALWQNLPAELYSSEIERAEDIGDIADNMAEFLELASAEGAKALYERLGLTVAEVMTAWIGLSDEATAVYLADPEGFTMRELLRHSPATLVKLIIISI